jgi:hypothetical protein
MGWKVYLQRSSSTGTSYSVLGGNGFGISTAWPATNTALGFFTQGGQPVTVGSWQTRSALVYSTATPTITRYVNNVRYLTATGFAVSTSTMGSGVEYYNRLTANNEWATPKPSYGVRFMFSTGAPVSFTQASAWYGVLNASQQVTGNSANAGFILAIKQLHSSKPWVRDTKDSLKMDLLINSGSRAMNNYNNTSAAHWFLAFSANPISAGKKGGAVAIDITYS